MSSDALTYGEGADAVTGEPETQKSAPVFLGIA